MDELVSIIIPVYKVEKYLDRCMKSVLAQTYRNLEIILVDDGSPDSCGQMCDEYAKQDDRVVVIHKPNGGVSSARNAGLERMTGDYVLFIDSDDYVDIHMVEYMLSDMRRFDADIVQCQMLVVFEKTNTEGTGSKETILYNKEQALMKNLCGNDGNLFVWSKLFRREIIGSLRFNEAFSNFEDDLMVLFISLNANKIAISNNVLYYYCYRKDSAVARKFTKKTLQAIEVAQQYLDVLSKECPAVLEGARYRYDYAHFWVLDRIMLDNEWEKNTYLEGIVQYIRKNLKRIVESPYLSKNRKIGAAVVVISPSLYRRIVLSVWKKKYD